MTNTVTLRYPTAPERTVEVPHEWGHSYAPIVASEGEHPTEYKLSWQDEWHHMPEQGAPISIPLHGT